jgi:hypothetical protein
LMEKRIAVLEGLDPGVRRQTRQCRFVDRREERRSAQLPRACRLRRARTGASLCEALSELRAAGPVSTVKLAPPPEARGITRVIRGMTRRMKRRRRRSLPCMFLLMPPTGRLTRTVNRRRRRTRDKPSHGLASLAATLQQNTACSPKRFQTHKAR